MYLYHLIASCFSYQAEPVEYAWTRYSTGPHESGRCNASIAATSITYIATIMNIIADWMLAILPATVVWQAQLDKRTKISISIILGMGSMLVFFDFVLSEAGPCFAAYARPNFVLYLEY